MADLRNKNRRGAPVLTAVLWLGLFPLSISNASAQAVVWTDGNELHGLCRRNPQMASAFVVGVVDGQEYTVRSWEVGKDFRRQLLEYCVPKNVTRGQLADLVCARLARKPETRHNSAASIVALAMQEAFPCQ
ncbi:hypothetical protein [Microcystis phage Mwe-JY25]